jgi:serine protease Do
LRTGQRRTLNVEVAERPTEQELARINGIVPEGESGNEGGSAEAEAPGAASARASLGMSLQVLTPELARRGGLRGDVAGLVITDLDPNSDAAQKGLRPGYVILRVDRVAATTPQAVNQAVEAARRANKNSVVLLVRPGNGPPGFVAVQLARS